MPTSTSSLMASILVRQFIKLQAPPLQQLLQDGIPPVLQVKPVSTPLMAAAWKRALANYPSREFAEMITNGIEQGFRIGLRGTPPPRPERRNSPLAQEFTISPG